MLNNFLQIESLCLHVNCTGMQAQNVSSPNDNVGKRKGLHTQILTLNCLKLRLNKTLFKPLMLLLFSPKYRQAHDA